MILKFPPYNNVDMADYEIIPLKYWPWPWERDLSFPSSWLSSPPSSVTDAPFHPEVQTEYEPRREETGLRVSDQVQHKPGCTAKLDACKFLILKVE